MIILGSNLIKAPIVSIQTGNVIAETIRSLIDPAKLNIVAYEINGPLVSSHPTYLRAADIRELSEMGAIIDSADEFIVPGDVIAIDELEKLNFALVGMAVLDENRHKLGKINDYTVDMASGYIQQLSVKRPFMKSLNDTELLVHRTQIIEINNDAVIVHSQAKAPQPERSEVLGSYINPFRKASGEPAPESISPQEPT